jgi:hypothetical protein
MTSEPFLIDSFNDSLVVIPREEARRLAALNNALEDSTTWGEFLDAVATDRVTLDQLEDKFDELPARDDPFDPDDIYGFSDGDWPAWPMAKMLDWLPPSVQALGTRQRTAINGDALEIDDDLLSEVIAALAAEGLQGQEDTDGLVATACGAWRY